MLGVSPRIFHGFIFNQGLSQRRTSYLLSKVRLLERLQNNDSALLAEFKSSKFVVFCDKKPLVWINKDTHKLHLAVFSHEVLQSACSQYDLDVFPSNSALVDVVCNQSFSGDVEGTFDPLFAVSLRLGDSKVGGYFANHLNASAVDLRMAYLQAASSEDANLLVKGNSLLRWSHVFKYCPRCKTLLEQRVSKCSAHCPGCATQYYPQVAPVAITLVVDSTNEHCLLCRQPKQLPGIFTAIAGFSEPGESLEQTAIREVVEEVGVTPESVSYSQVSQSWPFPQNSLMCAFIATASRNEEIDIDKNELEDADWFTKEDVQTAWTNSLKPMNEILNLSSSGDRFVATPPPGTLAHKIIGNWLRNT